MRFYQIILLVILGFCASNMETPPSARKRGFKLEFVGDNSEKETLRSKIQKINQSTDERMTYTDVIFNQALDFWINVSWPFFLINNIN